MSEKEGRERERLIASYCLLYATNEQQATPAAERLTVEKDGWIYRKRTKK